MGPVTGDTNGSQDAAESGTEHAPQPRRWAAVWVWLRAHSTHALVIAIVAGATPVVVTHLWPDPPACPGEGCDGRNPQKSGCAADAVGWQPTHANPVELQVRYSRHCGVLWGRILNGEQGDQVSLRVDGGSQKSALVQYGQDQFTPMARVGKHFHATACAVPTTYDTRKGTWKKYCIEVTDRTRWGAG